MQLLAVPHGPDAYWQWFEGGSDGVNWGIGGPSPYNASDLLAEQQQRWAEGGLREPVTPSRITPNNIGDNIARGQAGRQTAGGRQQMAGGSQQEAGTAPVSGIGAAGGIAAIVLLVVVVLILK